ncbi:tetratricopeptide repeat protein [bacterium]|nr:MAG: tetratricopeptide repeat protein [bacterium]
MEIAIILIAFGVLAMSLNNQKLTDRHPHLAPRRQSTQLSHLSDFADRLYAERKWLAAEKAYLNVLKVDHKNITAYTHLGVIYSTQKNMADAIECFQMAARIRPSGSTFQNLALVFHDNRNYMKAIAAFEKAISFEPTAARYLGLAKAQRRFSDFSGAIASLDKAIAIDKSPRLQELRAEITVELTANKTNTNLKQS